MANLTIGNSGIDFGGILKLQNQSAPPIMQVDAETNAENARASMTDQTNRLGLLQQAQQANAINATQQRGQDQTYQLGLLGRQNEQKQLALDTQKFGVDKAKALQEMRFKEQSNPMQQGILGETYKQAQNTTKQGAATAEQNVLALSKDKQAWDVHNQAMDVFNKAKANGATQDQAVDAMSQIIAQNDPAQYLQLTKDRQTLSKALKDEKYTDVTRAGDALYGLNQAAQESGKSLWETAKAAWKNGAGDNFPGLPNPNNYSNDAAYSNAAAMAIGSSITAKGFINKDLEMKKMEYQRQTALDVQNSKNAADPDNIDALQNTLKSKYNELQQVINTKGPDSKEAKTLGMEYKQQYDNITKKVTTPGFFGVGGAAAEYPTGANIPQSQGSSMLGSIVNGIKGVVTGSPSSMGQQAAQQVAPQAPQGNPEDQMNQLQQRVQQSQGQGLPPGITPQMIQQELARRMQQGQ